MRLHEITASNEVILKLNGLSVDFTKTKTNLNSLRTLIMTTPGPTIKFKPVIEKLILSITTVLNESQLDWEDPDLIFIREEGLSLLDFANQLIKNLK